MTPDILPSTKPRRKYGNKPVTVDGRRFASKAEARRHAELLLLERAGEVRNLVCQPRYPLVVNGHLVCTYVADFAYLTRAGMPATEDVKGVETGEFKVKSKLFRALMGRDVVVVRAK